ncbi:60S ribosomal protein L29, partial [Saguinus oedipus]
MAQCKNHPTHNQSCKWHGNGIKKPRSQRYRSLKGVDPKFPRNMHFAKKHKKKGLKKMQANNAKAMSAGAEAVRALVKPKEVKPKIPRGISRSLATCLRCTPQAWEACSCPHCQGAQAVPTKGHGQGPNR